VLAGAKNQQFDPTLNHAMSDDLFGDVIHNAQLGNTDFLAGGLVFFILGISGLAEAHLSIPSGVFE